MTAARVQEWQRPVMWVGNHEGAHGQLLVRGNSLKEIVNRAREDVLRQEWGACRGHSYGFVDQLHATLHPGWWAITPCRCRRSTAASNHPTWHYHRAKRTDPGAWRGAEVRIHVVSKRRTR